MVVSDIDPDGGEETVRKIEEAAGGAGFIEADVSRSDQVEALMDRIMESYGRLDYAHNNAGIEGTMGTSIVDCHEED